MRKNRDLLDYVSLSAQLVQTANTGAIRDHLNAISQLEAEKLSAAQKETSAQEREAFIRDFVFDSGQLIAAMKAEAVETDPCRSLVLFFGLRRHVEKLGITTTAVRTYDDKERIQSFLTALKDAIANCQGRLDLEARGEAEQCERFTAENPELEALIEFEAAKARLHATQARLDALNSKLDALGPLWKRTVPVQLSGSVIYCGILAVIFAAIRGFDRDDSAVGVSLVLSYILIPLGILMYRSKTPPPPEALEIQNEVETESQELKALTDSVAFDDWVPLLKQKFGEGDLETYRILAAERNDFVNRIMNCGTKSHEHDQAKD